MRYTGPRNRLARRQGADLELKTFGSKNHSRLMRLLTVPPGQHGANRRRKTSEMGRQLKEKQKLKFMFGVNETQMENYFTKAKRTKGNTGRFLCQDVYKRQVLAVTVAVRGAWSMRAISPNTPPGPSAVSYTHLDVYKRQV